METLYEALNIYQRGFELLADMKNYGSGIDCVVSVAHVRANLWEALRPVGQILLVSPQLAWLHQDSHAQTGSYQTARFTSRS